LADMKGRKNVFCSSILVSAIAQWGLMLSESYIKATFWLILFGVAWPGVTIVGLMYSLEFFPKSL